VDPEHPADADAGSDDDVLVGPPRPSTAALVAAFAAIVVGGLAGAVIGAGLVGVGCHGSCGTAKGAGTVVGGALGAIGVGIVAVLVLRAMSEWRRIDRRTNS